MRIQISGINKNMNGLKKMIGGSAGTLLLDGGKGSGNAYSSIDDYIETTNNKSLGMGLESLGKKLEKLSIKKTKPKNIKFNF